jgi:type II secretory pathway pseudopilin PulG
MTLRWRLALRRARNAPEGGFTIVETVIAMGLFGAAMILMTAMVANGMRGVLQGKQREAAGGESNSVLETARNLKYEDVGLVASDTTLAADTDIVSAGGVLKYTTDDPCSPGATHLEPLQFATNVAGHPFNPHTSDYSVGSTSLTRYVYVTGVDETCPPDNAIDYKRVVVRTVFNNSSYSANAISNEVRAQTFIGEKSPGSPQAPPSGSILPPLSGQAVAAGSGASILVDKGKNACIDDACGPDALSLALPRSQGTTSVLATSSVDCVSSTPRLTATTEQVGPHKGSASADDDGTTASPTNGPSTQTQPYNDIPPTGGPVDGYLSEPAVGSYASCTAAAPSWPGLPAESGTAAMTGSGTITYSSDVTGLGLPVVDLVKTQGATAQHSIAHSGTSQSARQVNFAAANNLTDLTVLKASYLTLAASKGLFHVLATAMTASAAANSTTPSMSPALSLGTGLDVEVFDPTNTIPQSECSNRLPADVYCRVHVDANAAGFTGKTIDVSVNMSGNVSKSAYSFQSHLEFAPKQVRDGTATQGGGKLYEASYQPLTATGRLILRIVDPLSNPLDPTYIAYFDAQVQVDLGQILARGCYGIASGVAGCL